MNHSKYKSVPMAGQLVNSSNIGHESVDSVLPKTLQNMRHAMDRGIIPPIAEHASVLRIEPLKFAALELEKAYSEALSDPLGSPTSASISENTDAYVISSGFQSFPAPNTSKPTGLSSTKKNLGSPKL